MEPIKFTLHCAPRTKKNSQRLVRAGGRIIPIPSKQYKDYERECIAQIPNELRLKINIPINLCCEYYMPTRRRVDLCNLLEATCDILVAAGVLEDDNCTIVGAHDGSRVGYDKDNPRVEITIEAYSKKGGQIRNE